MESMNRRIVAIGGGENGRINSKGEKLPYELAEIDREIIRLSGKTKPHFLFLAHSQVSFGYENEKRYYETIKQIFADKLGCDFRWLKASDLFENVDKTKEYVNWSDIIYEGGGDTVAMIDLWLKTGFDVLLKAAWESGKVMCGISAGAICWFSCGITDHPEYLDKEINCINGLGLVDAYFCPHCDKEGKRERINRSLKYIEKVGL